MNLGVHKLITLIVTTPVRSLDGKPRGILKNRYSATRFTAWLRFM
jgi:hypothetical protein